MQNDSCQKYEKVLQSYKQLVLDEGEEIELVHVELPSGDTSKRCKYVDLEQMMHEKRYFLRIQNKDDLCCARALVTAKARIDGHEKWNSIRLGKSTQETMAHELYQKARVPLHRCGIEEIKEFQGALDEYQIHVVSKEYFNTIIYEGPLPDKKIYLYHHDDHFEVITKMPAFLGRNYHCNKCKKRYDHKERHACNNTCYHCFKIHDLQEGQWKYCDNCNRHFKSDLCFDMHKQCKLL
jgi:hypothetical protein